MKVSKSQLIQIIKEEAAAFVWGVKNPGRVANIYSVDPAKQVIKEDQSLRDMQVPTPPPAEKMHALWYQLNLVLNRNHGLEDLKQTMQQISRDPDGTFPEEEEVPADVGMHHPTGLRNHPSPGAIYENKKK